MLNSAELPIIRAEKISVGYDGHDVLHGIDMSVAEGELIAIIGHNGSGKTTLLKALFGLLPISTGRLEYAKWEVTKIMPRELIRAGVAYVPQRNGFFPPMSVQDNLKVAMGNCGRDVDQQDVLNEVLAHFPLLHERRYVRGLDLSGGEKQSLSIAMALVTRPRLLFLDEPSLGLAPDLLDRVFAKIKEINRSMGISIIMIEQRIRHALDVAERVYILENGRVKYEGGSLSLRSDQKLRAAYLSI